MQNRQLIGKEVVAKAKPREKEYFIWDTRILGFGLRVRPSGAKSFVFTYRTDGGRAGKVRRVTLGDSKKTTPDRAREKAKAHSASRHGGADPAAEKAAKRKQGVTVADLLDRFMRDHVALHCKPKTARDYGRLVETVWKPRIGAMTVKELRKSHVADAYHAMQSTPTQAQLAVRVLSSAMSLAEDWGLRDEGTNPATIRMKGVRRRERLFSDAEVKNLLNVIDELEQEGKLKKTVALGLRLIFATGCRADEIASLEWRNVDFNQGVLRWPVYDGTGTKTGFLAKPMIDYSRELLEQADRIVGVPWVCPSPTNKKLRVETLEAGFERVMAAAGVQANENASLHLIRHWFSTKVYTDKSIPLATQMAIVGHKSVATAMRYAHVTIEEMNDAAAGAAERRAKAVKAAGGRGKVVALPGRTP